MKQFIEFVKIALIVALVIYFIINGKSLMDSIKNLFPHVQSDNEKMEPDAKVKISQLDKKFIRYTDSQIDAFAQSYLNAMAKMGTDQSIIISVSNQLNDREFEAVYNQFGKPKYSGYTYMPLVGNPMTLCEWLKAECTNKVYLTIKSRFNSARVVFP